MNILQIPRSDIQAKARMETSRVLFIFECAIERKQEEHSQRNIEKKKWETQKLVISRKGRENPKLKLLTKKTK